MTIKFTKMHGAGNDFVVVNALTEELPQDLPFFAKRICSRHYGIGADQLLLVGSSAVADYRMVIYNADGGAVEMCGNGIRCCAKFINDHDLSDKTTLSIETLGGIIKPTIIINHPKTTGETSWVEVNMGEPSVDVVNHSWEPLDLDKVLPDALKSFKITTVSMGNPHCVVYVNDVDSYPVGLVGPVIQNDPYFPKGVNVEFVQVVERELVVQRTWERGSGETLACGTGASAVAVASVLNGFTNRCITVSLKGGDLDLRWEEKTNCVFKTGPAVTVFDGSIAI
ncbi:MAG: diaminopimelate epimerase [bacterium]